MTSVGFDICQNRQISPEWVPRQGSPPARLRRLSKPRPAAGLRLAAGLDLAIASASAALAPAAAAAAPIVFRVIGRFSGPHARLELEVGLAVRVAVRRRPEALGVEGPGGLAALLGLALAVLVGLRLDGHGVLAGAGR